MGRRSSRRRRPTAGPPSSVAVQRLAHQMGSEVGHLKDGLDGDLRLLLLLVGGDDCREAAGVVDAQAERLRRFEDGLQRVVAAAVAEREAEAVLAAAQPRRRVLLPTLVASTTAAASLAVAVVTGPLPNPVRLLAGDMRAPVSQDGANETTGRQTDGTVATSAPGMPAVARVQRRGQAAPLATARDGLEVLRLIGRQGRLLASIAGDREGGPMAALVGVEELVARLVPEATSTLTSVGRPRSSEQQAASGEEPPPARQHGRAEESPEEPRADAEERPPAGHSAPSEEPPPAGHSAPSEEPPPAGHSAPSEEPTGQTSAQRSAGASQPSAPQRVGEQPEPSASSSPPSPDEADHSSADEAPGAA